MSKIGSQWRYEYSDDHERVIISTVDVDADDEGRTRDFGGEILDALVDCEDEVIWAITATPVMLNALQSIRNALSPDIYAHCPEVARLIHGICNRAITEATTDPNAYIGPGDE